jgi:hypothetical protein
MTAFIAPSTNSGVEQDGSWMMVPLEGSNFISLVGGKGLKLKYNKARIKVDKVAADRPDVMKLRVTGLRYGETELKAGNAEIVVSVKNHLPVKLAFYIVRVEGQASTANLTAVERMIDHANKILTPQANIGIQHKGPTKTLLVKSNTIYQIRSHMRGKGLPADTWDDLVKLARPNPQVKNVFFIKELILSDAKNVTKMSKGLTHNNNAMIPWKNSMSLFARTLAHETIHLLGFGIAYHAHKGTLMDSTTSTLLPRELVDKFNTRPGNGRD